MTEKQAVELLQRLKIPTGYQFTKEEVAHMLEATSLPNPTAKKSKKSSDPEIVGSNLGSGDNKIIIDPIQSLSLRCSNCVYAVCTVLVQASVWKPGQITLKPFPSNC